MLLNTGNSGIGIRALFLLQCMKSNGSTHFIAMYKEISSEFIVTYKVTEHQISWTIKLLQLHSISFWLFYLLHTVTFFIFGEKHIKFGIVYLYILSLHYNNHYHPLPPLLLKPLRQMNIHEVIYYNKILLKLYLTKCISFYHCISWTSELNVIVILNCQPKMSPLRKIMN